MRALADKLRRVKCRLLSTPRPPQTGQGAKHPRHTSHTCMRVSKCMDRQHDERRGRSRCEQASPRVRSRPMLAQLTSRFAFLFEAPPPRPRIHAQKGVILAQNSVFTNVLPLPPTHPPKHDAVASFPVGLPRPCACRQLSPHTIDQTVGPTA
eukprot:360849-Chlamydomonas_euryale.AAC.3